MYDDTVDVTPEGVSEGAALSGMFGESAPVETERGIETITEEIIFYKNVGGQAVIEIGRRLTEAKAQLKHGEWLPWLREKVEFSETSAQNFMRIAREYGNTHLVGDLGASKALVLLALPASERENFAQEKHVVNGEEKSVSEMSKRELEEAIRQRKLAELKAAETARELDRQKEATAEAEAAAEKAQEAAEAARAEVEDAKSISLAAQERTAELERELKALREKPGDVAARRLRCSRRPDRGGGQGSGKGGQGQARRGGRQESRGAEGGRGAARRGTEGCGKRRGRKESSGGTGGSSARRAGEGKKERRGDGQQDAGGVRCAVPAGAGDGEPPDGACRRAGRGEPAEGLPRAGRAAEHDRREGGGGDGMKVQLTRDLALPLAKKGCTFGVELKTTGKDGETIYFVHYYGNTIAFPADACEEVE
jgi:flagellar biosynthesis GTPase FlhF